MKYIVFPIEKLNEVPQEVLDELHLAPRKSIDGTKVIMKVANYELLFPSTTTLPELGEDEVIEIVCPYPTYEGKELETLLSSEDWTTKEKE